MGSFQSVSTRLLGCLRMLGRIQNRGMPTCNGFEWRHNLETLWQETPIAHKRAQTKAVTLATASELRQAGANPGGRR